MRFLPPAKGRPFPKLDGDNAGDAQPVKILIPSNG